MQQSSGSDDFWYRKLFQLRVHGASGDAFQQLVSEIYGYAVPDFQPVTPWGNWGDGGNDGWIPSTGHYLQLYGPKPTTSLDPVGALKKALTDYDKLTTTGKWKDVREYSFVLNDRFQGIPAPIASELQTLQTNKGLVRAGGIGAGKLEQLFMSLPVDQRQMIVGGVPASSLSFIPVNAVGELLTELADRAESSFPLLKVGIAPEFSEKLKFNNLCDAVSMQLKAYSYHVPTIDAFLDRRDPGLKQAIAQEVQALYQQSKTEIPDGVPDAPDLRYVWLTDKLVPAIAASHRHTLRAYRESAQIVLAKYFETCDAYESPR